METGSWDTGKSEQQRCRPQGPKPTEDTGFFPRADLAEFDAHLEDAGQIGDEGAEVHPLLGEEAERDLAPAEDDLGVDQLHVEAVLGDEPAAGGHRLAAQFFVSGDDLEVLLVGQPHHPLQRRRKSAFLDRVRRVDHLADLGPAHGLHDHLIAATELQGAWIEVIDFAARLEDDTHDIGH